MEKHLNQIGKFIKALEFASVKHEDQRRKGVKKRPYINHPVKVTEILTSIGKETDINLLTAAILHDTIEDTKTTKKEIQGIFGKEVAEIVDEMTDNMKLSHKKRKELQIEHSNQLSEKAKKIKIADKTANILDLIEYPIFWSKKRKIEYIEWTKKVIDQCLGVSKLLEDNYYKLYQSSILKLKKMK